MIKKIIAWSIIFLATLGVNAVHAQEEIDAGLITTLTDSDVRICQEYNVVVSGPDKVTVDKEQTYILQTSIPRIIIEDIIHEIRLGDEFLESFTQGSFQYSFENYGSYTIKTLINTVQGCTYVSQKAVNVYNTMFLYIGGGSDEFTIAAQSLQRSDILLYAIQIASESLQSTGGVVDRLVAYTGLIDNADYIILDAQSLGVILAALPEVEKIIPLGLDDDNLIVLASINNSAFRRLIGTYSALSGFKEINLIPHNTLSGFITGRLAGRTLDEMGFVTKYSTELQRQPTWYFMSYLVDLLLLNGIPLQMIILLLLLPLFGLVITFYRHVLGFATYGVFGSLLVGLSLFMIGIIPTFLLLFAGLLSVVFTTIVVRKIYVLTTAKQALIVGFYALFLILLLVVQQQQDLYVFFPLEHLNNTLGIFLMMYMLIISGVLFKDSQKIFTKKRLYKILQFSVVILTIFSLLRFDSLHNLLLGYPELVLAIMFLILLVGRYTGLQVTEYFRFAPLIARTMSDHEEEE